MSTSPHKVLKYKLGELRQSLNVRQQNRRQQRLEELKKTLHSPESNPALKPAMGSDVAAIFNTIQAHLLRDRQRLSLLPAEPAPAGPGQTLPAPGPLPTSPLFQPLVESYMATEPLIPQPGAEVPAPPANAHVLALMRHELALLIETNTQFGNIPGPLLAKLKQAVQAYTEGRTTDCITVLKNALTGDPHNQTLLMCLSQVLYALAASGNATALPEARDIAQRSTIANQKQRPPRLEFYQYLAIVTERMFSEERAMEWLRDSGLLAPELLFNPRLGLWGHQCIPLRAWGVLSTISPNLWGDYEFKALQKLVTRVVGGAALYMCWLREPLMQTSATSKTPFPALDELERMLGAAAQVHKNITAGLSIVATTPAPHAWIIRWRWLRTLTEICGIPNLETVLCMVALDGQNWRENVFPDREIQVLLDDPTLYTWRVWAQSITPFKDMQKPYLLPADETAAETDINKEAEELLILLKNAEIERVRAELWPELKPWLVRWQLDHFLATATGSNQPRNRFAPSLFPYSHFYRRWQEPQISGLLASEVIAEVASRGGFSSWFEMVAAFEGALRLLDDPQHGLQATQRRAFNAAQKKNPSKFSGRSVDFGRSSGSGLGMLLAPLGFVGALLGIFTMAANTSQAIGLSLALFGLAGVVMLNLSKK